MQKLLLTALLVITTLGICEEKTFYYYLDCWSNVTKNYYVTKVRSIDLDYFNTNSAKLQFGDDFKAEYGKEEQLKSFSTVYVWTFEDESECIRHRKRHIADKVDDDYNIVNFDDFEYVQEK